MAMRLGTEDKKKRLIAMVLVAVALTAISRMVWWWTTRGVDSVPASAPTSQTATSSAAGGGSSSSGHSAQHLESASNLDPTLHPEWMALAENTRYTGTSRNIFSKDSLPPAQMQAAEKPIAPVRTGAAAAPAGPPPPPAINLKFYGFATEQNGRKLIFLLDGEDVFIAGQGDIVDGRYKVVSIGNTSVVVQDLAYNDKQTLALQTT
jgi:hypothetical protein